MARDQEPLLDGFVCCGSTFQKLVDARDRMAVALREDDPRAAAREVDTAVFMAREALREFELYVDGLRIPKSAMDSIDRTPRRMRQAMLQGVIEGVRSLVRIHPRLDRLLETAASRREEGKVFAEEARERRDALYRERVSWVCSAYHEVRAKYPPGVNGDKAARLEVAVKYSKVTGRKPMHDRSVCNILAAAARVEPQAIAETPA